MGGSYAGCWRGYAAELGKAAVGRVRVMSQPLLELPLFTQRTLVQTACHNLSQLVLTQQECKLTV